MDPAAFLAEESQRLATLHALHILDTAAEERFDRLTRLASKLFDMPVAAVSLLDMNRAWFKSCVGTDVTSVPRDLAFCTHALNEESVLLIPDASKDPRFSSNPLVVNEPKYRFYVGCPLRMPDGSVMGTLCLLDTKPHDFNSDDLASLRDLADMAERELAALSLASTDELTGLSNRRGFMTLGRHALAVCQRARRSAMLMMFDLDHFKQVNDAFGHAEGDQVLKDFAGLLMRVFRSSDVIARWGGDEFLVLLTNTDPTGVHAAVARFREALAQLNREHARSYEIACSVGTLMIDPQQRKSLSSLLAEADALMYEAKRARPPESQPMQPQA